MKKENINIETGEFIESEVVNDSLPINLNIEPQVSYKLPEIEFNYLELADTMERGIKEYALEVTYDNLKEAKQASTKLNKLAKAISDCRIKFKKEILVPVDEFEKKMKDLTDTAIKGKDFLKAQIKVFDDEMIAICKVKCEEYLNVKYEELGVNKEFQIVDIEDINIASNLSESLNLTKKAKDTIIARVNIQLTQQTNKKMRLMQLENECLKAELKVLLTEDDVKSFILGSDLVYSDGLSSLILREQNKQKQIEMNLENDRLKKLEQEKRQLEFQQKQDDAKKIEEVNKSLPVAESEAPRKKIVRLTAIFEVVVDENVDSEKVLKQYENKLQNDFTTFVSIG